MDLTLVIVAVEDLSRAVAFWRSLTGWDTSEDVPGVYVELRCPNGMRFGIYESTHYLANLRGGVDSLPLGYSQPTELYLTVPHADRTVERAIDLGAVLYAPASAKPWGDTVAYLRAPGGFVLAVAAPTKDSPDPHDPFDGAVVLPAPEDDDFDRWGSEEITALVEGSD